MSNPHTRLGYVYLVHNPRTGFYKIGATRRPTRREAEIRKEMRAECRLLHAIWTNHMGDLERAAHQCFAERLIGGEWFALTSEDVRLFRSFALVAFHEYGAPGPRFERDDRTR